MIGRHLGERNLGQSEDRIAHVDALGAAPQLPDGVSAVALVAPILDVVVHEREVVDQLDGHGRTCVQRQ